MNLHVFTNDVKIKETRSTEENNTVLKLKIVNNLRDLTSEAFSNKEKSFAALLSKHLFQPAPPNDRVVYAHCHLSIGEANQYTPVPCCIIKGHLLLQTPKGGT
jgi:hypothetical protein